MPSTTATNAEPGSSLRAQSVSTSSAAMSAAPAGAFLISAAGRADTGVRAWERDRRRRCRPGGARRGEEARDRDALGGPRRGPAVRGLGLRRRRRRRAARASTRSATRRRGRATRPTSRRDVRGVGAERLPPEEPRALSRSQPENDPTHLHVRGGGCARLLAGFDDSQLHFIAGRLVPLHARLFANDIVFSGRKPR